MDFTWIGGAVLLLLLISCIIGYRRGFIKEIVSMFFLAFIFAIVWWVNPYVNEFIRDNTPVYEKAYVKCDSLVDSVTKEATEEIASSQNALINQLPLPEILKSNIKKNNTSDTYQLYAADNFHEYLVVYLSEMILKGISFVISFLIASIIIHILTYLLNLMSKLPIINGVNKIAGAVLGMTRGVLFIWVVMLVITLLCNTKAGIMAMEYIEKDAALKFFYNNNILVRIFMSIINK